VKHQPLAAWAQREVSAVLALIPLAGEIFWAPMALAMMGGLIAATILTLTFLPALYALAFRVQVPSCGEERRGPEVEATTTQGLPAAA
jgi:hypothetical protein